MHAHSRATLRRWEFIAAARASQEASEAATTVNAVPGHPQFDPRANEPTRPLSGNLAHDNVLYVALDIDRAQSICAL